MTPKADETETAQPTWRKPVGILLICFLILIWVGVVVSLMETISNLSFWLQLPIYIFAGLIWILPLKPAMIWMNTGKFRHSEENGASDGT